MDKNISSLSNQNDCIQHCQIPNSIRQLLITSKSCLITSRKQVKSALLLTTSRSRADFGLITSMSQAWYTYYEQVTSMLRHITCMLRLITNMLRSSYVLLRLTTSKSEPYHVLLQANQNQITSYCEQIRPDRVLLQVDHDHITSMSQTNHEDVTSVLLRTDHEHVVSDHAQIMTMYLFRSKHKYVSCRDQATSMSRTRQK